MFIRLQIPGDPENLCRWELRLKITVRMSVAIVGLVERSFRAPEMMYGTAQNLKVCIVCCGHHFALNACAIFEILLQLVLSFYVS